MSSACERLLTYIQNFKKSLSTLRIHSESSEVRKIIDLALRYVLDSEYYYEKGDCETGLVTISYAEGLLDALRLLNMIEFSWLKSREIKVVVGGSFDILHPGHIEFLRYASRMGSKLYVIVARDKTYKRIRGIDPIFNENERLKIISSIRWVYRAYLGSEEDMLKPVEEIKPDIIVLGPDQVIKEDDLYRELKSRGLENINIHRLPQRFGNYSSRNVKKKIAESIKMCGNL